jgi:predicted flap endonuclease-1-like 5' DNA nuclease
VSDTVLAVEETPEPEDLVSSAVAAPVPSETRSRRDDHHNEPTVERNAEPVDIVSRVFGRSKPKQKARDTESLSIVHEEDRPEGATHEDTALTGVRLEDRALSEDDFEQDVADPEDPALAQGVIDIAGIGPTYAALLRLRAGIHTIQDLLQRGATADQRAEIARKTGLSERLVARWVRRADLMRIDGIGEEYGELLDYGGLESVAELARSNAQRLYERLRMANAGRNLVQRLPSVDDIRLWIDQAKVLD